MGYEWTTAQRNRLVRLYNEGTSMTKLAAEYDVSTTAIRRVLVEEGVTIKGKGRYANV